MPVGIQQISPAPLAARTQSAREAFPSGIEIFAPLRTMIETRYRRQLERLAAAEAAYSHLLASTTSSTVDVTVTVGKRSRRIQRSITDLEIVRRAVRSFEDEPFDLDLLVSRLRQQYPDGTLSREIVSRRLFDLRKKGAVIEVDDALSVVPPKPRQLRVYRRNPTCPSPEPPPGGGLK